MQIRNEQSSRTHTYERPVRQANHHCPLTHAQQLQHRRSSYLCPYILYNPSHGINTALTACIIMHAPRWKGCVVWRSVSPGCTLPGSTFHSTEDKKFNLSSPTRSVSALTPAKLFDCATRSRILSQGLTALVESASRMLMSLVASG